MVIIHCPQCNGSGFNMVPSNPECVYHYVRQIACTMCHGWGSIRVNDIQLSLVESPIMDKEEGKR